MAQLMMSEAGQQRPVLSFREYVCCCSDNGPSDGFDGGLVTLNDDGAPAFSAALSGVARADLRWFSSLTLTSEHKRQLVWHRRHVLKGQ